MAQAIGQGTTRLFLLLSLSGQEIKLAWSCCVLFLRSLGSTQQYKRSAGFLLFPVFFHLSFPLMGSGRGRRGCRQCRCPFFVVHGNSNCCAQLWRLFLGARGAMNSFWKYLIASPVLFSSLFASCRFLAAVNDSNVIIVVVSAFFGKNPAFN